jgi:hypothetical protein
LRLLRSTRLIMMREAARAEACFCSACAALAAFLAESLLARFWASRERVEVAASRASGGRGVSERTYGRGWAEVERGVGGKEGVGMRGSGTYQRSKSSRTYRDGAPQAIPGTSWSFRQTRSTIHHTCQPTCTSLASRLSRHAPCSMPPVPSRLLSVPCPSRRSGRGEGVCVPQVAACRLSIRQLHNLQNREWGDVPPQYTICLACGSGAVSVSAIAGRDGFCGYGGC